jgi:acyl transferase domain-containing protein
MHEVFGCRSQERGLWLTAVKSQIGHLMGAAGAAGALKTVLGLYHKVLPLTINHLHPRETARRNRFRMVTRGEPWPENPGTATSRERFAVQLEESTITRLRGICPASTLD